MKNILSVAVIALTMLSCNQQTQKTGFVDSNRVVSEFNDMIKAKEEWTAKNDKVRSELQQKATQFQMDVQGYGAIKGSMSKKNREKKEQELMARQQELQLEQQTKMKEMQEGSQVAIDSIISKVKDYINNYGEKNGYVYIYGKTEMNNIFYAKEEFDLTDKILTELNGEAPKKEEEKK